jgi:hypothetical protein
MTYMVIACNHPLLFIHVLYCIVDIFHASSTDADALLLLLGYIW